VPFAPQHGGFLIHSAIEHASPFALSTQPHVFPVGLSAKKRAFRPVSLSQLRF